MAKKRQSKIKQIIPQDSENPLLSELEPILKESKIPEAVQAKITERVKAISYAHFYRSPIPSPEILRGYSKEVQNGAERMMRMVEEQTRHRIAVENKVIDSQIRQSERGQNYALFIAVLVLFVATAMTFFGHEAIAGIIAGLDIVGLVTVFFLGKDYQMKNLKTKSPNG